MHEGMSDRDTSPIRIGNDVVDLRHPACRGRAPGDPFAARILAESERAWLGEAADVASWSLRLWALWAAKETAFKALEKGPAPSRIFRPSALVCELRIESLDVTGLGGGTITRFTGRVVRKAPGGERDRVSSSGAAPGWEATTSRAWEKASGPSTFSG